MKKILSAYWRLLLFKSGLLPKEVKAELTEIRNRRLAACEDCILKTGGWCDKNKTIVIRHYVKNTHIHTHNTTKSGCGCWLKAKSLSEPYGNPCPLKRW